MHFFPWKLLAALLIISLTGCAGTTPSYTAQPVPGWEPSQIEKEINDGSRPWSTMDWQMWQNRMGGSR